MFRNILNETINFFYQTPEAAEKKQEEISPGNVGITIMATFNTGFNGKYGTVMQKWTLKIVAAGISMLVWQ